MKIIAVINKKNRRAEHGAFTLAELMVASTIFLIFVVGAMVAVQIYGLRVYTLASTKIKATTSARQALNTIRDQIRAAYDVNVGIYTNSTFLSISNGLAQQGNAIQIFTTTNTTTTNAIVFYQDPANNVVNMVSNNVVIAKLASNVTNYYCFLNENFQGTVSTSSTGYRVIEIVMQFNQWAFPVGFSGSTPLNAYDYYRLRTRITRRIINNS